MIPPILTNPTIYNITQTTQAQVAIETGLKAIGRPGFILLDNSIDKNTKKYSSMKEFLYQLTCMALSLGIVIPVFKKGSFGIARKLFKEEAIFQAFKKSDDFNKFRKLSLEEKVIKLNEINSTNGKNYQLENLNENLAKGMIEITSIAGSILGLSILSPLISRPFIRPVLKTLGMGEPTKEQPAQPENTKVDVKA